MEDIIIKLRTRRPAKDPNNNPDPDDAGFKILVDALSAGSLSLGALRRDRSLQPTLVGRLTKAHPKVFATFETGGKPHVKLLIDPVEAIISVAKRTFPVRHSTAAAYLEPERSNVSADQSKRLKSPRIDSQLVRDPDKLIGILEYQRYSTVLEEAFGFSMARVRAINIEWPDLLVISPCVSNDQHQFFVSLAHKSKVSPSDVGRIQTSEKQAQPPAPVFSKEDWARMRWRPPSRGMGTRRVRQGNNTGMHRERHPLVALPGA